MPMYVNLAQEDPVTTLVTDALITQVKQNLGFDTETADTDIPVDIPELMHQCISVCEKEQWRFILRKPVTLNLPYEAFAAADRLMFLPFGRVTSITTFSYKKTDGTTANISSSGYTLYQNEPAKLFCKDWAALFVDIDSELPYPITVTYTTGYSSLSEVPKPTVRALMILAYHLFEYRDAISDGTVKELPQGYCQLRDLSLLNDMRAIRYVAEDWTKVSRG